MHYGLIRRCAALPSSPSKRCGTSRIPWPGWLPRNTATTNQWVSRHCGCVFQNIKICFHRVFQQCPGCETYVEREELDNLDVVCTICTADKMKMFHFCWQCMKPWKGRAPRSDRCDNDGCVNHDLQLLQNCNTTSLPQVVGVDACPSIRACPTCGQNVEHDKTGCKNIICPRCQVEFCFVCLKLTDVCLRTSTHFRLCSDGMAPRQTSIPVWHR